jgi:hypothetical protein
VLTNPKKFITFVKIWNKMAETLKNRIENIRNKANVLVEKYHVLLQEKQAVDLKVGELEATVSTQEKEILQLRQEVEYLQLAMTITPDRKQVESSRAFISNLVREIDRCITELTE